MSEAHAGTAGLADADSGPAVPPLEARALRKVFRLGDGSALEVLAGVDLVIRKGEAVAVVGSSGAGKSTLLHLLGALDRPTSGEVIVGGEPVAAHSSNQVARIRNRHVGFVFQFHHLLREFTALENVAMPALLADVPRRDAETRARELLIEVGLGARLEHKPWQLSGGEQQRVAVARALVNRPAILLADEPSGNLDQHTSEDLHRLLFRIREERNLSMVVVTHSRELAEQADRILELRDGVLVREGGGPDPEGGAEGARRIDHGV